MGRLTSMHKSLGVAEQVHAELVRAFAGDDAHRVGDPIPVGRVQHRVGSQVVLDGFLDMNGQPIPECDGLVWVTVVRRFRTRDFPVEAYDSSNCQIPRAVTLQVGVARCSAMMDEYGSPPPADRIKHEAIRGLDDAYRLDLALCRAGMKLDDANLISGYALDSAEPIGPEGGVVSWMQQASFRLT